MRKPLRYFLIFLALLTTVCLVATAAGISVVKSGVSYDGWGTYVDVGTHQLGISIYEETELRYDRSRTVLPVSWLHCLLAGILTPALLCLFAAATLTRPLFASAKAKPESLEAG